jgi:hypothetical protein
MLKSRTMLLLAQVILIVGAVSLLVAAWRLFLQALAGGMPTGHLGWLLPVAVLIGIGKARFVMQRRMQVNARRLAAAAGRQWPWQVYPPQILVFIAAMVLSMLVLKHVFATDAMALGLLGGVDLAVAVALLITSWEYRWSLYQ